MHRCRSSLRVILTLSSLRSHSNCACAHGHRFRILSDKTFPHWDKDARSCVQKILDECNIKQHSGPQSAYEFGKTKVFIRLPQTVLASPPSVLARQPTGLSLPSFPLRLLPPSPAVYARGVETSENERCHQGNHQTTGRGERRSNSKTPSTNCTPPFSTIPRPSKSGGESAGTAPSTSA